MDGFVVRSFAHSRLCDSLPVLGIEYTMVSASNGIANDIPLRTPTGIEPLRARYSRYDHCLERFAQDLN